MKVKYKCSADTCQGASAPHERGMCVLAGVNELRDAVEWANSIHEFKHDNMTAEQILARFRRERDS